MLARIKKYVKTRKQLRLREDPQHTGDRAPSTIVQTANTELFHTIGTSGTVMNVVGDFHMYTGDSTTAPSASLSAPPPSQPLAPDIWFGRDDIIYTLATIIAGNENPRIAILGAGGIGKTATALHLIRHEAVVARYGDRTFFVACDATTSAQLLASRILQIIGVSASPRENMVTAMHIALKCAPPTLLLLDNFESAWEAETDHTATRDLLQKIADSPLSTLIITMRAATPPPGIRWTSFESLPPLLASSAKEVFLAINATFCKGSNDGDQVLDELLRELDYVPLAIHLLAHVSTNLSPRFILKQWQKQRTHMLSLDSYTKDKLESVNVSISLSMKSLDIERNPGAIQLLGMLCLLPDGLLRWQERLEIIESIFETATSDLLLLRKLALVYTAEAKLGVLSPIRHFVLKHHPPDARHAQCIYNIIWELVRTYGMVDFGPEFSGAVHALSPEMGNIGNLIDHAAAYDPGETIVDIAIQISWYIYHTHPSPHMLQKVHDLAPLMCAEMQAQYCHVSGAMMYLQHHYAEASSMFTQARDLFLEIEDRLHAAVCSRRLGEALRMQNKYSRATATLVYARSQFLEIGENLGAAQCSLSLGAILKVQSNYSEATAILVDTRAHFLEIGNLLGVAQCSHSMGDIRLMQRNYSEATAILTDAQAKFIEIGDCLGAAQCLQSLGNILRVQGNYSEATAILTDVRAEFLDIGDRLGATQCSQSLGNILRMHGNYSEATTILTEIRAQFLDIGDHLGAIQCSQSLGNILRSQGNYSEATAILTDVRAQFIKIGDRLGAAQCSLGLGDILTMQSNYSEAITVLADVRAEFLNIGDHLGATQCLQSLNMLTSQGNYSEPRGLLMPARNGLLDRGYVHHVATVHHMGHPGAQVDL
ncbi:TPR-like protein [Athelia psychrophila]|uniref:TPR-like protein n=1 Tax=Athelia psychrophila TaxID=1759441 RepID=A0A166G285_9AGAM|nr:TPR-like protein [Fibularhizoctonia sp. CBS 109695]